MKENLPGSFLGGLLKGLGELAQLVEKLETEGKTEIRRTGHFGNLAGSYGLSVRVGNLKDFRDKMAVQRNEPLLDVFDESNFIQVVVEVPEVSAEEEVEVKLEKQTLWLTAQTPTGTYQKRVFLPVPVEPGSVQKMFKNGLLKITLKKVF